MTSLSRTILENFQVRKSKKQKLAFADLLREHFPELTVQKGGFPTNRNLILGDVENAKVVLSAHYDTCAVMPFPNFITPKKPLIAIGYSLLMLIPMVIAVLLLNLLLNLFTDNYWVHYWSSLALWFGLLILMMAGPANRHTANDNTSGVITLIEIYAALTPQQRQQVAFVFFDNEELGLLGSSHFRSVYKKQMQQKLLINFDCVSDGDHMLFALNKSAEQTYAQAVQASFLPMGSKNVLIEKLEKLYYPSDQAGFKCAIAVASLKKMRGLGYYMDRIHTPKDTVFMEENIHMLRDGTCRLLSKLDI